MTGQWEWPIHNGPYHLSWCQFLLLFFHHQLSQTGVFPEILWGGVNFGKIGSKGVPPWNLLSFDRFVNCIVAIVVNFLDFVNFLLFLICFQIGFFEGCNPPTWTHPCSQILETTSLRGNITEWQLHFTDAIKNQPII